MSEKSERGDLEETIKRHVEMIHDILMVIHEKAKDRREALAALTNVTASIAYAEGVDFEGLVFEMGLRYSALDQVHEPPGPEDAIH